MPRPITRADGPTMPCPFCGITVRTTWNPHTTEFIAHHGEDALAGVVIDSDGPPTEDEARDASELLAFGIVTQILALHGLTD